MVRRILIRHLCLLKIPSEPEFERLRGISIESIRSGEGGCNPNVRSARIKIEEPILPMGSPFTLHAELRRRLAGALGVLD